MKSGGIKDEFLSCLFAVEMCFFSYECSLDDDLEWPRWYTKYSAERDVVVVLFCTVSVEVFEYEY